MEDLSPEQYAQIIADNKPYLIELERNAEKLSYGTMEVTFTVRAGVVSKMEFKNSKTWLKP